MIRSPKLKRTLENDTEPEPHPHFRTPCLIWKWAQSRSRNNTYGRLKVKGRMWYAHRFYYTEAKGEIPEDAVVDHLCERTLCVNPDHLMAVTVSENAKAVHERRATPTRDDLPW